MKLTLLTLLSVLLVYQINAQWKFFIDPKVNFNLPYSYVDPSDYNSLENKWIGDQNVYTPFLNTVSKRFIPRLGVRVGLGAGAISANGKHLYELEWCADRATIWIESEFQRYNQNLVEGVGIIQHRRFNRIGFNYSYKFFESKGIVRPWITFGLGLNINTNQNDVIPHSQKYGNYWLAPHAELKEIYMQPFAENRVNGYLKIGLKSDFYIKDNYLFTLGVQYIQGIGAHLTRLEYVTKFNVNNQPFVHNVGLMSRETTLNFQISRRFQLYPWIKSKRKELQEQGVYKSREK